MYMTHFLLNIDSMFFNALIKSLGLDRILTICFIFLISCHPLSLAAAKFEIESDATLFKYFASQCEKVDIFPNAFPDYYMGREKLNYCDIASAFEPEKFSFNYQFLKTANFKTTSVIKEYDNAEVIFSKRYGWRTGDQTTKLDRALLGDVIAYYELVGDKALSPLFGANGASIETVRSLSEHFDPVITELLFLNEADFKAQLSAERLSYYSNHLLRAASHVSVEQILQATWRLNDALYEVFGQDGFSVPSAVALEMPHELRMNILALGAISKGFDVQLLTSLRLIEYNENEVFFHFAIGTEENFYRTSTQTFDEYFLQCSRSILVALEGAISLKNPISSIYCLLDLKEINSNLFQRYVDLTHEPILNKLAAFDMLAFQEWISTGDAKNLSESQRILYQELLVAEIRHALSNNDEKKREAAKSIIMRHQDVGAIIDKFSNNLLLVAYRIQKWDALKENYDISWIKRNLEEAFSEVEICSNISDVVCDQLVRYLVYKLDDYGLTGAPKNSVSSITNLIRQAREDFKQSTTLEVYTCRLEPWKKTLLRAGYGAGAFDPNVQRWCNSEDFKKIVALENTPLSEILAKTGAFPNSPAINYLTNSNLWNMEQLGILFLHFHSATPIPEIILFPDNGVGVYAKSLPTYQWLLSSDDIEHLFFKEFQDQYWKSIKPLNSISNFLLSKGKFELAYLAQRKFVEQNIDEKHNPLMDTILPISLVRLKYLARQASIPDEFISEEVNTFLNDFYGTNGSGTDIDELFAEANRSGSVGFNFLGWKNALATQIDFVKSYLDPNPDDGLAYVLNNLFYQTDAELVQTCNDRSASNYAADLGRKFVSSDSDLLLRLGVDETLVYDFFRYLSICMLDRRSLLDYRSLVDEYLLPSLKNGTDLFDPNLLPVILLLSDFSEEEDSLLGAYTSLVFAKHYFGDLSEIFVSGNSNALRSKQSNFELLQTNVASVFKRYNQKSYPTVRFERMAYQLQKLSLSFHFPILSYKSMDRMIDEFTLAYKLVDNKVINDASLYSELKQHYKAVDVQVAKARNPQELAIAKAAYSSSEIIISPNVLGVGDTFEQFVTAENYQENVILANVLASDDAVFMQTLDPKYGFTSEVFQIATDNIGLLRDTFADGEADTATYAEVCRMFEPIRKYFSILVEGESSLPVVILTPSVNLFPIPVSVIAGNFCNDLQTSIVITGDVSASVELNNELVELKMPNHFIGLGNPMPKSKNNLAINLGNLTPFRGLNGSLEENLEQLPSLPDAVNEVVEISKLFEKSDLFLNHNASIIDALEAAVKMNATEDSVILNLATHAFAVDYSGDINLPAMLTVQEDQLGIMTSNEVGIYDLSESVVLLSACNTASGAVDRPDLYFSGFVEGFANTGSKLITASLWPVKSRIAKDHSVKFINGFRGNGLLGALSATYPSSGNQDLAPLVVVYP